MQVVKNVILYIFFSGQGELKSKEKRKRRKVKSIYFEGPKGKKRPGLWFVITFYV